MIGQHTIYDIADQCDRLCPSQVDRTISGNGSPEAGHVGHEPDTVGWYCAGGNIGEAIFRIPPSAIDALYDRMAALDDGALDDGGLVELIEDAGGEI